MLKVARCLVPFFIATMLMTSPALAKPKISSKHDAKHDKNHTQRHLTSIDKDISTFEKDLTAVRADVSREEDQIQKLQESQGGIHGEDLRKMQETIQQHNVYFAILTGLTGVIAAAVVGELIRRWMTAGKT